MRRSFSVPLWRVRAPPASVAVLLLVVILLAAATIQAWLTARAQRHTADSVMRGYAEVAAWIFEQRIVPALEQRMVEPLFHPLHAGPTDRQREPLPISVLTDRDGSCPMCAEFTRAARFGLRFQMEGDALQSSVPVAETVARHVRTEVRRLRREASPQDRLAMHDGMHAMHVFSVADSAAVILSYAKPYGSDQVVYVLILEPQGLAGLLDDVLATDPLLPDVLVRGTSPSAVVAASVRSRDGALLYGTAAASRHVSERRVPKLGGATVQVEIMEGAEAHLMLGGAPGSHLPLLLALLGMAIVLMLVAVSQVRHEHALTALRAGFVSSVSHELRTPLALQRIFLDMLRLGRVATAAQRQWCIESIDRESRRLAHLVENVLHFSRAERGGMKVAPQVVSLRQVIEEITQSFMPIAAAADANVQTQLEDVNAPVDVSALRQMLMNLLENAIKYGPPGQIVVVGLKLHGDGVARITVSDEGPGIPHAEFEAVFRPYWRGSAANDSSVAGSGIGLAVVRALARAHGGEVLVQPGAQVGTTIVLDLPHGSRADTASNEQALAPVTVARLI